MENNADSEFDFSELSNEILKVMQAPTNEVISSAPINQATDPIPIQYPNAYSNSIWNNKIPTNTSFKGNGNGNISPIGLHYYQSYYNPISLHSCDLLSQYNPPKASLRQSKYEQTSNEINVKNILSHKDFRTTLMIRHIPNKYNIAAFLEDINKGFIGKYDILYLPLDFVNNCNLGYAFINFVDPLHIVSFYDTFRGKKWPRFKSEKICELAYAKFQGRNDLINHFKKGATLNFDSEEKKPIILPINHNPPKVEIPLKYYMDYVLANPWGKYEILQDKLILL